MIETTYKNNEVILKVSVYPLGYVFSFTYNAGSEWAAKALWILLSDALKKRVQEVRKFEYEQGLKDSKKKKAERKDWFYPWLENK